MLTQIMQRGKDVTVLLFTVLAINLIAMTPVWATDSDGDGLEDDWETAHGFNPNQDNTGDAWIEYVYDVPNGNLTETREYVVDPAEEDGLLCVSDVRKDYDELGRVWRTRRLATPGSVVDNENFDDENDKIDITVYDVSGRVTIVTSKGVGSTNPDAIQSTDVRTDKLYYDAIGRLYYTVDPEGLTTLYTYTDTGALEKVYREWGDDEAPLPAVYRGTLEDPEDPCDVLLLVSTRMYDDAGRLEKTYDAKGNYQTMAYNSLGQVIKTVAYDNGDTPTNYTDDTASRQTRTEYDYTGNTTRQAVMADATMGDPCSIVVTTDNVTDYDYDGSTGDYPGKLASVSTYINNSDTAQTTTYDYDEMGRVVKVTDPADNETHTVYNDAGRVERNWTKEVKSGFDTVYTITDILYGTYGQAIEQRQVEADSDPTYIPLPGEENYPDYIATQYDYNGLGQLLKVTDAKGHETTYGYNWLGKVAWTNKDSGSGGIGQKTDYGYDRLGRQVTITGYASGTTAQTTTYAYSDLDQVLTITYPDAADNTVNYNYYPSGQVKDRTDQRGIETDYEYDANGNLLTKTATIYSVDYREVFTYDGLNRMLTAKKYFGSDPETLESSITFSNYTSLGHPGSIATDYSWDTEKTSTFAYDQAGNLKQIDYPDSSMVAKITLDYMGRIASISKGPSSESQTTVTTYSYLGSRVAKRIYNATNGSYPVTYEIDYDNLGRPEHRHTYGLPGNLNIAEFNYTFDDNGNITDQVFGHRTSDPSQSYTYDTLDRLTEADYIGGEDEQFTYDKLGNRTLVTLRNNDEETYAVEIHTNQYDESGEYDVTHTYDEAGNLATDHRDYIYTYDYENRLVKVVDGQSSDVADYAYDALGRRVKSLVHDGMSSAYDQTNVFYYDGGWRVLAEYRTVGETTVQYDTLYGNYLDEVLMVRDITDESDYYYAHDHLYSPAALLEDDGTVLERYEYDAYGRLTAYTDDGEDDTWFTGDDAVAGASDRGNVIAFTGQRLDVLDYLGHLKLMYYKNRYYDGEMGRFLTRDPLGYADGMNLYRYVHSSPTYGLDPSGLINCMAAFVDCSKFPQNECCQQSNSNSNNFWNELFRSSHDRCEANKQKAINDPKVRQIMSAMQSWGCPLPPIECRSDGSCQRDGVYGSTRGNNIVLCENRGLSTTSLTSTLIHEMTHAYDNCRKGVDDPLGQHLADDMADEADHHDGLRSACAEIRANANAERCKGKTGRSYERCIKDAALGSVKEYCKTYKLKYCKTDSGARRMLDEMFDACIDASPYCPANPDALEPAVIDWLDDCDSPF